MSAFATATTRFGSGIHTGRKSGISSRTEVTARMRVTRDYVKTPRRAANIRTTNTASAPTIINPTVDVAVELAKVVKPVLEPVLEPSPTITERQKNRYCVRVAENSELYTVADIRCEAFYGSPRDANYYPVRRREIYVAMRDRVAQGNKCLIVVDEQPGEEWGPFVTEGGGLVVGSCDVAMHVGIGGVRQPFRKRGGTVYVSSMAVRNGWRGRGLAQRLLGYVDHMVDEFNIGVVYLHVEWDNCVAVHVYKKCGFQVVKGRAPGWLGGLAKSEHTLLRKEFNI